MESLSCPVAFRGAAGNVRDSRECLSLLDVVEEADPEHAYGGTACDSEAFREASSGLYEIELSRAWKPEEEGRQSQKPEATEPSGV